MQLLTLAGSLFLVIYSVASQSTGSVGPCTKARQNAGKLMPGEFIPACTDYGYFQPTQCHGSTGRCWCVVPDTGKAIEGTETFRTGAPECSMCNIQRAQMLRPGGMVGYYVPTCDDNGLFTSKQQWASTGQNWCVNKYTGDEIQGTRTGPTSKVDVNCDDQARLVGLNMHKSLGEQGPCYAKIVEQRGKSGTPGFYTPRCTANGYYRTEQRHSSTGYTWCANPMTGDEIPNTRRGPSQPKADCGACFKEIEEKLSRKFSLGSQMPQCNMENGDYVPEQQFEGYRWCANPKTGAVEGKKYSSTDNTPLPCVNN